MPFCHKYFDKQEMPCLFFVASYVVEGVPFDPIDHRMYYHYNYYKI
jgi:hypothetical protein